jgi:hypothetical protein
MEIFIITFKHGNYAVAAFSHLEKIKMGNVKLSQIPFSIKSECDLCIKTNSNETLRFILRECKGRFPVDKVYGGTRQNGVYLYKLLPMN